MQSIHIIEEKPTLNMGEFRVAQSIIKDNIRIDIVILEQTSNISYIVKKIKQNYEINYFHQVYKIQVCYRSYAKIYFFIGIVLIVHCTDKRVQTSGGATLQPN